MAIELTPVDAVLERANYIPSVIVRTGLISTTNSAYACFAKQKFSSDLQAFLINYVITVQAYQSIYK
jgi:hypothetical protein